MNIVSHIKYLSSSIDYFLLIEFSFRKSNSRAVEGKFINNYYNHWFLINTIFQRIAENVWTSSSKKLGGLTFNKKIG